MNKDKNLLPTNAILDAVKLTTEQKRAMEFIDKYGAIERYEGGFWSKPQAELDRLIPKTMSGRMEKDFHYPGDHVGTNTIKALLKKGLLKVSKEKEGKYGKFPIECVGV